MKVPKYKGDITQHAYNGFEECCSYEEMLSFLRDENRFMSVSKGIKRDLLDCLDFQGDEDEIIADFKAVVCGYGFTDAEMRGFDDKVSEWFCENKLPNRAWAIRLCFAFGLDDDQAGHFLWKVCKLNGFSYRSAEDVIYCYCLANGKPYQDAKTLIDEYKANPNIPRIEDYKKLVIARIKEKIRDNTVGTKVLQDKFSNLKGMTEDSFRCDLFANTKYFINYSVSAHFGILTEYEAVVEQLKLNRPTDVGISDTVEMKQKDKKGNEKTSYVTKALSETGTFDIVDGDQVRHTKFDGQYEFSYESVWTELSERNKCIAGTEDRATRPTKPISSVCNHVCKLVSSLPPYEKFKEMTKRSKPQLATEKDFCYARNVFVFLYFAQFVLRWERYLYVSYDITKKEQSMPDEPPEEFFGEFYESLNIELENCGYGYLYYANPFDWHILSCVRLLDENLGGIDEIDALTHFNEALSQLAEGDAL